MHQKSLLEAAQQERHVRELLKPSAHLKFWPLANGPEQRGRQHLETRRRHVHVLWEHGEEIKESEYAIAMRALVPVKGFPDEPILEVDV